MKIAIITIAGISSRFNHEIEEKNKVLKCIYSEENEEDTLLGHLIRKCAYADRIILVGGYKYDDLKLFFEKYLRKDYPNVSLIYNEHYDDLASGYSLYLGINEALKCNPDEILFVEGDLDVDKESFCKVIASDNSVLTYTYEPIYANKAVVLYKDETNSFKYAYNSSHRMLKIDEPFSCILNSGQIWKFKSIRALEVANNEFFANNKADTNLGIIQRYLNIIESKNIDLIPLKRWTNCNTREDYRKIKKYWEDDIK